MKHLFLALIIGSGSMASAQSGYTFSYSTGNPYTPLSSGTDISAATIWDDNNWAIPMGFSIGLGGKTVSDFLIYDNEFMPASDTAGIVNTFVPLSGSDWADRGLASGTHSSPIRYTSSGSSPNRIFKLEYANAGFFEEFDSYGTMNDSASFQVWVYETSGIIEFHYGDSYESHGGMAFYLGGPLSGYLRNTDLDAFTVDMAYGVKNNPLAPDYDSTTSLFTAPTLSSIPPKGVIYRYTPVSSGTGWSDPALAGAFQVYPSQTNDVLRISNPQNREAKASIYDIRGTVLQQDMPLEANTRIDVSQLAPALYFLNITTTSGRAVYRFVKQ